MKPIILYLKREKVHSAKSQPMANRKPLQFALNAQVTTEACMDYFANF